VKILKSCRKAIPPREAGGKVIIINMVIGAGPSDLKHKEMQAMFDVLCLNEMSKSGARFSLKLDLAVTV